MSFCQGGFKAVHSFMKKIDDALTTVITDITIVTGKIKDAEASLTGQIIINAIPNGGNMATWLNSALDILYKASTTAQTFDEKLLEWIKPDTPDAKDAKLVKLASVATAVADNKQHPQSFYDTAVQVHVMGLK